MDKLSNYKIAVFRYPRTENDKKWNANISDSGVVWGIGIENPFENDIKVDINLEREKTGSVIEKAFEVVPPPIGTILAVLEQNIDTVGSIAVIDLKSKGHMFTETEIARIKKIADESPYLPGRIWPGPRPLPNLKDIWSGVTNRELYHLSYYIEKSDSDIYEKINVMKKYIKDGLISGIIKTSSESYRYKIVNDLENNKIKFKKYKDIYLIKSNSEGALEIGHYLSPIIVLKTKDSIIVSRYAPEYLDLDILENDINMLEGGWKKVNNLLFSPPQTKIKPEAVVRIIQNYGEKGYNISSI